jgi:phosphatidyl-myo-inositol dimannoside synthase
LGTKGGGVGVVAELLQRALAQRYCVKHLEYRADNTWRSRAAFALALAAEQMRGHALQVYSHIDLARSLTLTPRPNLVHGRATNDVVFVHGIEVWRPLNALRRAALKNARLLANSNFTQQKMRLFHPSIQHIRTAHLGVDFAPMPGLDAIRSSQAVAPTAVIVGRMSVSERYKGHDQLIEAWPSVLQVFPNAQLICIGGGDDVQRLSAKCLTLQLEGQVRFAQGLDNAARDRLVRTAHLSAFPSTGEGFGLAAIEAASLGLPVLAIADTVLQEIFALGNGAIYAKTQSAEALSAEIIRVFQAPEAHVQTGLKAAQYVRANYCAEHFIQRFWQALDAPDLRSR